MIEIVKKVIMDTVALVVVSFIVMITSYAIFSIPQVRVGLIITISLGAIWAAFFWAIGRIRNLL